MARQKIIPPPIVNIAMAVMSAASNSSSPSALELASKTHKNIFFAYMCWLAIAAIATLLFTWALWKSTNRRQDAAKTEADLRVLKVEQTVADSKRAAAEAIARAAEANKIAEEERLARVKLEARLAPRSLSAESRQKISAALKQFAPQVFDLSTYPDDLESRNLAVQIFDTVRDAGWTPIQTKEFLIGLQIGVIIDFAPSKADGFGPAVRVLASALQEEGIIATTDSKPEHERLADRIRIRVGKKP